MRTIGANLGLFVAFGAISLIVSEGVLRAIDFKYDMAPERVEFGYPDPALIADRYLADPDLFWVPKNYHGKLIKLGQLRPEIIFMGDSCTEFGTYPRLFMDLLEDRHPGRSVTFAKLGVGGWSSYQGLQQLKRDVVRLRPSVATFYFGWNDHWRGFGIEDGEIHWLEAWTLPGLGRSRLAQLLFKSRVAYRAWRNSDRPVRVSPDAFRNNLRELSRVSREQGIIPVFLTAPTSHESGHEPKYLNKRWLDDLVNLVPLHQSYVAIVREIAGSEAAVLCDLAASFETLPSRQRREHLFLADGIHLAASGEQKIAEFLGECFEKDPELRLFLANAGNNSAQRARVGGVATGARP